jgi:tripartite-type tricarboxylate transporter receptor subunit TctC
MPVISRRNVVVAALACSQFLAAHAADPFPSKPIRVVVNAVPGGSLDITTRLVAKQMGDKLGQSLIVDNRAGGDGLVGIRAVLSAPADGYTLLATAGTIAIQPAVKNNPGYDLLKDFTGIGPMLRSPLLLLVGTDQPDKTLVEFTSRAKASPGKLAYASAGFGTTTHIGAALFAQHAGVQMQHIPYKGSGAALPDVAGGRVPMIMTGYSSALPLMKSGKLRALGVSSTDRLPGLPELPTIAEQGVANFSYHLWLGLLAPAGTPAPVVQKLSEALRAALRSKELEERFRSDGSEVAPMGSDEFNAFLRRDLAQMNKLVTELGLPKE